MPKLPFSLTDLNCSYNQFETLPFMQNLVLLECSYNNLIFLPTLPVCLKYLYCEQNKLVCLPSLKELSLLKVLDCENNNLSMLPYYDNTFQLECSGNPIYNIICCHDFVVQLIINSNIINYERLLLINGIMKENNCLFNHFREVYFLSKLKKKFLSWMWKSREERIKQEFHPNNLWMAISNFENSNDSEELNQWMIKNNW